MSTDALLRIRYALTKLRAWACFHLLMLLPAGGEPGGLRWALLPHAGAWAHGWWLESFAEYRSVIRGEHHVD